MREFREIEGCEGYYVSNDGVVENRNYRGTGRKVVIKGEVCKGYRQVTLISNGVRKRYKVHRLVALAFVKNPENKPCVDHIDTDKLNNNYENLRWVTSKENSNNPLTRLHISRWQIGIKFSEERKRNISRSLIGKRKGVLNHNYGKPMPEWQKDCIRRKVAMYDNKGNLLKRWNSVNEASECYGVCPSTISKYCRGKRNCSGGYRWAYV